MKLFESVRLVLFLVMCGVAAVSHAEPFVHRCIPGSELFACQILTFSYDPEDNIPQFHLPNGTKSIRIIRSQYHTRWHENCLQLYDKTLHKQLYSPLALEVRDFCLDTVEMPSNLEYADFTENRIRKLIVPPEQSYALRYLSLNENFNIKESILMNVSKFVNLETLYLGDCNLHSLPKGLFEDLNRLKRLYLGGNSISQVDLSTFPTSLTMLRLEHNIIDSLDFPKDRFPALKHMNIEDNRVKDVNVGALLAMAPNLKLFALGHNAIKRNRLPSLLDDLVQRNVAYYNTELPQDNVCLPDERKFRGACIPESSLPLETEDWVGIIFLALLALVVSIGLVFGGVKLWAKYPPSWEMINYFKRQQ